MSAPSVKSYPCRMRPCASSVSSHASHQSTPIFKGFVPSLWNVTDIVEHFKLLEYFRYYRTRVSLSYLSFPTFLTGLYSRPSLSRRKLSTYDGRQIWRRRRVPPHHRPAKLKTRPADKQVVD